MILTPLLARTLIYPAWAGARSSCGVGVRCSVFTMRPFSNVNTLSNHCPELGMAEHPECRKAGAVRSARAVEHACHDGVLGIGIERRERPVDDQQIGALQKRAPERQLLLLGERQALGAAADVEAEPKLDDRARQVERVHRLAQYRAHPLDGFREGVDDAPEEHIVLHARRRS